jgi:hypothetical protein
MAEQEDFALAGYVNACLDIEVVRRELGLCLQRQTSASAVHPFRGFPTRLVVVRPVKEDARPGPCPNSQGYGYGYGYVQGWAGLGRAQ